MKLLQLLLILVAGTAAGAPVKTPHVEAELVPSHEALVPGETITVALRLAMIPGWHTYWRNPGDSGEPTRIEWRLPPGFKAGPIGWPVPERIPVGPLMNFGYKGEVLLPVRLEVPRALEAGSTIEVRAKANWLVCQVPCIPEEAELSLTLPVAQSASAHPRWASAIDAARAAVPTPAAGWSFAARAEDGGASLFFAPPAGIAAKGAFFLPFDEGKIEPAAAQRLSPEGDGYRLQLARAAQPVGSLERLSGVLVEPGRFAHAIEVPVGAPAANLGLLLALAAAFAGGLILNLMPCVLPVVSIKILSFASEGHARLRSGLLYAAGVLASFWLLAAVLIALRALGAQLGWGFQLQSSVTVALLAALFLVLALNLSGVFELRPAMASRPGGHFLSGVLAVIVASPCTAPFMGVALGYALLQSGWQAFAVFTALGVGMAFPYVLLAALPGWRRRLPKPGPWMVRFKQVLAIPLYATVAWLLWVLALQLTPAPAAHAGWQPYSTQGVEKLVASGTPVFVDFTAAWCVTCQVNERVVLARDDVRDAFRKRGVTLVRADWTRRDAEIAQALAAIGRSGVPAYVLYKPGRAPLVLPEIITRERLLEALDG